MLKQVSLKDVAFHSKGKQINGDQLLENGIYDYLNGGINPSGKWNEYNTESNTVTISEGGNSSGFVNFMTNQFWCGAHCYYLHDLKISPKYLYYALKSQEDRIMSLRAGAAMPNIKKSALGEFVFNIDDDSCTQNKIVNVLDNISEMINKKNQQLSDYDQLIKSRFVELFGDISINSKSFDIKPFGDLCFKIGDGLHGTPLYDDKGNYYFINGNNLGNDCIKITETTKKVNEEVFKKYYIQFGENTVFLSINGTLGNVALYNDEPIILGKSAAYCNLKPSLHIKFVAELFKTNKFKEYMLSNSSGTTITNFGLKAFRNYPMIVPPMILQTQFTKFVEQVDKLKFETQRSLDETKNLFDSLMQEYFA